MLYFNYRVPFTNPKESKNPKLATLALQNLTVRELAYDNLFIFYWRLYRAVSNFYFTVRKSLTVPIDDKYQAMNGTANHLFNKILNKNRKFQNFKSLCG
jgi:hypothetical protein